MILRKPYAFLIKYFRRINIILFLLVGFMFYTNLQTYQFAHDYVSTGVYNVLLDSINNYINIYVYLAAIATIVISGILVYLLRYKDKPYATYLFILGLNLVTLILFIYTHNYFTYTAINGFKLVNAKLIQDLLFISSLPYYVVIFLLIIRCIGLDLKNFGFEHDGDVAEISEEDREEVEVQVGFDKHRFIRKIKYRIRYFKYFFLEHKFILSIIGGIVILLFIYNSYNYFYVENRIYKMNEVFTSNYYDIKVNHTYLTDKDFAGNIVSENGRYFIIVDVTIHNRLASERNFDIEKMFLFVDNDYYVPTTRFNTYFSDMGNLFDKKTIKPNTTVSYILIYEINKPNDNANFVLKYQDLVSKNNKLIRVKMKILDISTFKTKDTFSFNTDAVIPINEEEKVNFKLYNSDISDTVTYRYQYCYPDKCPIFEKEINAKNGYKILYLKGSFGSYSTSDFLSFLSKYGKIRFTKDGKTYDTKIEYAVNGSYQGNHIYLLIPNQVANADSISLMFTIRTYQYFYKIKGE